jgi:hypothetical protein
MAAILIIGIALVRPLDSSSEALDRLRANRFWIMKAQNKGKYAVLILGDSRSYRGLSPAEMSKSLGSSNIYNLAFSAGGLNQEIYDVASGMLDMGAKHRMIVLGVTPGSLMASTENNRQYREEHNRPQSAYLERVYIDPWLQRFVPFDWERLMYSVADRRSNGKRHVNRYADDGWVGSGGSPEDPTDELNSYREVMARYQVKEALVQALFDQTRMWSSMGVRVFGFRPPTSQAMLDLENKMSGFDEREFVEGFEAAGGKWIPVEPSTYHSYDGSHLDEASAIRLSDYIAAQISQHEKPKKRGGSLSSLRSGKRAALFSGNKNG